MKDDSMISLYVYILLLKMICLGFQANFWAIRICLDDHICNIDILSDLSLTIFLFGIYAIFIQLI